MIPWRGSKSKHPSFFLRVCRSKPFLNSCDKRSEHIWKENEVRKPDRVRLWVELDDEFSDYAKVTASATNAPEKIGVGVRTGLEYITRCSNDGSLQSGHYPRLGGTK